LSTLPSHSRWAGITGISVAYSTISPDRVASRYHATIALPAELSAAAVLISFWNKAINPAAWITITMTVAIIINYLGVGKSEVTCLNSFSSSLLWICRCIWRGRVYFCVRIKFCTGLSFQILITTYRSIKVIAIVGLLILGIVLDLGGELYWVKSLNFFVHTTEMTGGPNHDRIGFRYWKTPGPFAHFDGIAGSKGQFLGWWAVMTQAAFSFIGTEIVAVSRTGFLSVARILI
jgi:amino acid transporter